jgi:hypothetical protein
MKKELRKWRRRRDGEKVMRPVIPLHPALGLRRIGSDDADSQSLTHPPKLRHRHGNPSNSFSVASRT